MAVCVLEIVTWQLHSAHTCGKLNHQGCVVRNGAVVKMLASDCVQNCMYVSTVHEWLVEGYVGVASLMASGSNMNIVSTFIPI